MAQGVNIITNNEPVVVEGAKELIEEYETGSLSREELYERLLDLDVVYIDRQRFKAKEDVVSRDE
jgi:hypothetical protein